MKEVSGLSQLNITLTAPSNPHPSATDTPLWQGRRTSLLSRENCEARLLTADKNASNELKALAGAINDYQGDRTIKNWMKLIKREPNGLTSNRKKLQQKRSLQVGCC